MRAKDPIEHSAWGRPDTVDPPARAQRVEQSGLRREQIVATAIELLDTDGITGLSMRRLADALDAGTTSAYWYVRNKGELLDLAFDEVLAEVPLARAEDVRGTAWRAQLAAYATELRSTLLRHPWMVTVVGERPNVGPRSTALSENLIGMLITAGFGLQDASYAASGLTAYALGSAVAEASWRSMQRQSGHSAKELDEVFTGYFEQRADSYPNLANWIRHVKARDIDVDAIRTESFEFGLERHIDGLATLLRKPRRR